MRFCEKMREMLVPWYHLLHSGKAYVHYIAVKLFDGNKIENYVCKIVLDRSDHGTFPCLWE